jgi:hypothetical protein
MGKIEKEDRIFVKTYSVFFNLNLDFI